MRRGLLGELVVFVSFSATCRILVTRSGIEPVPPSVEAWSLNHEIAREVPHFCFLIWAQVMLVCSFFKFLKFLFLAALHSLWDLSSRTRD